MENTALNQVQNIFFLTSFMSGFNSNWCRNIISIFWYIECYCKYHIELLLHFLLILSLNIHIALAFLMSISIIKASSSSFPLFGLLMYIKIVQLFVTGYFATVIKRAASLSSYIQYWNISCVRLSLLRIHIIVIGMLSLVNRYLACI